MTHTPTSEAQQTKNLWFAAIWQRSDLAKLERDLPNAIDHVEDWYDNVVELEGKLPTHARVIREVRAYWKSEGVI
jgi:hypothetical protein